jgi:hypothetical protein
VKEKDETCHGISQQLSRIYDVERRIQCRFPEYIYRSPGTFGSSYVKKTENKQPLTLMSKDDLSDYVEIALSFRMVCKYPSNISIKLFSLRLLLNIVNLFNIFVMQRNQMDKHLLLIQLYSYPSQRMLLMN